MKILILVRDLDEDDKRFIVDKLSKYGKVIFIDNVTAEDILTADVAVIFSGKSKKTREMLRRMKKLRFLQTLSAGVDEVPFNLIPSNTIIASNSGANAEEAAEYAIALLLAAAKKITLHDRSLRKKVWNVYTPKLVRDSKVLIWGYGKVGREIAKRLKLFRCTIYGINRSGIGDGNVDKIYTPNELNKILHLVDYIILTLPLTKETREIVNRKTLSLMKKDAVLINIGRGSLINEKDLYQHLVDNPEFIVALDVWWRYPKRRGSIYRFKYPFYKLDNIIMSPHVAGYWEDYKKKLLKQAIKNVLRYLRGREPHNIVNRELYI